MLIPSRVMFPRIIILVCLILEMPNGKYLTPEEKAKIIVWTDPRDARRLSQREIARRLGRSRCVVQNFLAKGGNYGWKPATRGNKKLTNRQRVRIVEEAVQNRLNASEIKQKLDLPVTRQHVAAILKGSRQVKWGKPKKKPALKQHHKTNRLEFAKRHMAWTTEWNKVIFSDEKKFNLDGPDCCNYHWHALDKPTDPKGSRNFGGGNVMVWGAFSSSSRTPMCFISHRMTSTTYTELLENELIDLLENTMEEGAIFQQDNAPIHVSRESREWFSAKQIPLLAWPACSPDLNPIENLWAIMARRVYGTAADQRTFNNALELKIRIKEVWNELEDDMLQTLVESMPNRIFEVICKNGGATKY